MQVEILVTKSNGIGVVSENTTLTKAERRELFQKRELVCIVRVLEGEGGTNTIHISRPGGDMFAFHNLYKKLRTLLGEMNSGAR